MGGNTHPPRLKSLARSISKHALLARNRSRPLFGRSKVTLLSPTLSTQTQAKKPKGRGRTVIPPHTFQTNAPVRHGSPSQFPIHTSWAPNDLLPGSSLLPSRETSAPPPWRPTPHQIHRRPPPQCRRRCPFAIMHWVVCLLLRDAGVASTTAV